jgi:hypothetical protein
MNYINMIAESLDDLDYDGPEEGQEFENTYVYIAGCPVGSKSYGGPAEYCEEAGPGPVYVNIINDNTIRLWIAKYLRNSDLVSLTLAKHEGILEYNPITKKCKWISEDISMVNRRLADIILNDFKQMMIIYEGWSRRQRNLAEMVESYLDLD